MNLVSLSPVYHAGYNNANEQWGGGHDKTSKLRKQNPYPDIFIDQLCLDLESHERTHLPCQIRPTDAFQCSHCFSGKYEKKERKELSVWQREN